MNKFQIGDRVVFKNESVHSHYGTIFEIWVMEAEIVIDWDIKDNFTPHSNISIFSEGLKKV